MTAARAARGRRRADPLAVARWLGVLLLAYYLVPLLSLFVAYSPAAVLRHAGDAAVVTATANSLLAAGASALLATALGVPLAYWLARTASPLRHAVLAVVVLPLVLPPIVSGMLLLSVFGPRALGGPAAALGLPLTRSLAGVVLAQTFVASPFVVVTAKAAFDGVDVRLEHASRSLGVDRAATLRRVTLPIALPGVVAGVALAFARSMGEFGATVMMAYHPRTMPVQIWVSYLSVGLDAAFPLAALLLVVSLGAIALVAALGRIPWS